MAPQIVPGWAWAAAKPGGSKEPYRRIRHGMHFGNESTQLVTRYNLHSEKGARQYKSKVSLLVSYLKDKVVAADSLPKEERLEARLDAVRALARQTYLSLSEAYEALGMRD